MAADTPRNLKLNASNDLDVSLPNLQVFTGLAAIGQACQTALQMFQGEWFLDLNAGVPYFQQVLVKNPAANVLSAVFRSALLGIEGVSQVLSLSLDQDTAARTLNVTFEVMTDVGLLGPQTVTLTAGVNT